MRFNMNLFISNKEYSDDQENWDKFFDNKSIPRHKENRLSEGEEHNGSVVSVDAGMTDIERVIERVIEIDIERVSERVIEIEALEDYIQGKDSRDLEIEFGISKSALCRAVSQLRKADVNRNGIIDRSELLNFYNTNFKDSRNLMPALQFFLYQPTYTCLPPPLFILIMTIIQIFFSIYHKLIISSFVLDDSLADQAPTCSLLIYNPGKRFEVWRFLTYQFVHVNTEHIVFNILIQIIVGIPLEMSQPGMVGTFKVMTVYLGGVVLGSLGASLALPHNYLAGASAGVYALIAAHLATLVLNWKEDGEVFSERVKENKAVSQSLNPIIRWIRLLFVLLFTFLDIGLAVYNYYSNVDTGTSYMGHIMGAAAGLLLGIVMLENRKVERWETKLKYLCIATYLSFLIGTILWHIIGSQTEYFPPNDFSNNCRYRGSLDSDQTHY